MIFLYGEQPFLKGGLNELKSRQPGMMLLIGMAIAVAFAASWVTSLGIGGFDLDFWWELALLVAIMLLGRWIEMRALGSAQEPWTPSPRCFRMRQNASPKLARKLSA